MQIKLSGADTKVEATSSELSAKVVRPETFVQFAEMMNLFTLYMHGLQICSVMVLADFFEHVVYDTIRQHGNTWEVAHELMLITFRRVEDSGFNGTAKLNLGNIYDELYLNSVVDEARQNVKVFFRSPGGNPGRVNDDETRKFNGTFNKNPAAGCCSHFNAGTNHASSALHPDGTCKKCHVCDHWVSNKGKYGRCLGSEGTKGHARGACDNPHKCDARVEQ